MTVSRHEVLKEVSQRTSYSQREIGEIYDALFATIGDELIAGNEVRVKNFGRFFVTDMADYHIKHPVTHEDYIVKGHRKLAFHASESLRDQIKYN